MNTFALWNVLRNKLGASRPPARPIALQHVGLAEAEVAALQAVLDRVGQLLDVRFALQGHSGEIVLMEADFEHRMSPQLIDAFTEGRPVVVTDDGPAGQLPLAAAALFERRQQVLLRQLREIPLVRRRSGPAAQQAAAEPTAPASTSPSGYDSSFDSTLDAAQLACEELQRGQQEVMQRLLRGLQMPGVPALCASYGEGAHLRFDFRARLVTLDRLAQQHLRLRRELPQPTVGGRPQSNYIVRELDETAWDLGLANGRAALVGAPAAAWWRAPLKATPLPAHGLGIEHYTRLPRHLEMARLLRAGPVSPSGLRRQARVGVADVRAFLQACLVLGLVQWVRADDEGVL